MNNITIPGTYMDCACDQLSNKTLVFLKDVSYCPDIVLGRDVAFVIADKHYEAAIIVLLVIGILLGMFIMSIIIIKKPKDIDVCKERLR